MFQLTDYTEAHVASVTNRIERHGDEEVPAVSLGLEITSANTLLDQIDPALRHALYMPVEGQEALPGVEVSTPVLRCNSFDSHALATSHEGWRLAVDDGIDATEPMIFGGVKVDRFRVEARQGGSIVLRFRVGTSDVDAAKLGKLAMHNGQSIWITLMAPDPKDAARDDTQANLDMDRSSADAGELFAQAHRQGDQDSDEEEDSEGGATDLEERPDNAFARADAEAASSGSKRTARGRRRMREALANREGLSS